MFKTIIKATYSAFISIVLISLILAGWTGYTFISQPSKSSEIVKLIQNIYSSQKTVLLEVIDLSRILIKDKSDSIGYENNDLLVETKLKPNLEDNSKLDKSQVAEDNGDNALGIVIEPSLPEVSENSLPELIEKPFVLEQDEFLMPEIDMEMDMNS
tara:strand:+ start:116 stop:583 length:468 start_codon:yes stop_codon:yes gene_type:complete